MKKVIIIGGGIVGMSAAYTLAKAKYDVTIIDREGRGQATDAAAGIICPWLSKRRNKVWYELAKLGARYYHELIQDLTADVSVETGYKQVGALCIRERKDTLLEIAEIAARRREEAPEIGNIDLLSVEETKNVFPIIKDGFQAIKVSGGARVDGRALRQALEEGAIKHGAKMIKGTATLHVTKGMVEGVNIEKRKIPADKILIAAGAWAKHILSPLGIRIDITPQKGQLLHVQLHAATEDWPVILPPSTQSIVPFDHGRIVIGATHEKNKGFDLTATVGGINEIVSEALQFAPELEKAEIKEIRVGSRAFTSDFSPIIGQVPKHPMLWIANGLGASGLTTGPVVGRILAQAVMDEPFMLPIHPYNPAPYLQYIDM